MLILLSAVACLFFCLLVMFLLCAMSVGMYYSVYFHYMLCFYRETRKADTQEKHLELAETVYNHRLNLMLSRTPPFIICGMKTKQ